MKQVTFQGTLSGDGECFRWDQVPPEDMQTILGPQQYKENLRLEQECYEETGLDPIQALSMLYPSDIWEALGCEPEKKYRFTIQVEPI
jgi:hypothetical protein